MVKRMRKRKSMTGISNTEIYAAFGVGIGMVILFDHFHLISSAYWNRRVEVKAIFLLSVVMVMIIWSYIAKRKKD